MKSFTQLKVHTERHLLRYGAWRGSMYLMDAQLNPSYSAAHIIHGGQSSSFLKTFIKS